MIKIENVEVCGWKPALTSMRNPMNSWEKNDSRICCEGGRIDCILEGRDCQYQDGKEGYVCIGPNDHDLAMRLVKAGTEHRKFLRMITVYVDITAPTYMLAQLDTYKVGTVRNSCSFMHKGLSEPFSIRDFSVATDAVYEVLSERPAKEYKPFYPYETDEYKEFEDENGRTYRVYRNGKVMREAFSYVENYGTGRTRNFDEAPATMYQNRCGYTVVKLSGRSEKKVMLHRLVATMFCEKKDGCDEVNHIDGNKGNNCAENLEWVTKQENIKKAYDDGLYDSLKDLKNKYRMWKKSSTTIKPEDRLNFKADYESGMVASKLGEKYSITEQQANNTRYTMRKNENEDLFLLCYQYETLIGTLNDLRELYLETKDETVFQNIRALLPQGYMQKATFMFNYEVLSAMYRQRKDHRLPEWTSLCAWIETLPYSEFITGDEKDG